MSKPFNLQDALAGKPVVYRNGEKVKRIIHVPEAADDDARIMTVTERGSFAFNCESGSYNRNCSSSDYDLFMATEKKTVWVNVYEGKGMEVPEWCNWTSHAYATEELALAGRGYYSLKCIATKPIEIEV